MESDIYQIKIELKGSEPKIWRRFLLAKDTSLHQLHQIIQSVMGWTNSHLHQFEKNKKVYCFPDEDMCPDYNYIDYSDIKICDILQREKEKIFYEYDFGDGWIHEVQLEKTLAGEKNNQYPICIKGEMNCPPEDCGGIGGYYRMLGIVADPDHEEYEDMISWLGDQFDPKAFDIDEINDLLRQDDFGCPDIYF